MSASVLWLLAILGAIGAFDTLYYHEWRARLPARYRTVAMELRIHAVRDVLYAIIFGTLPWLAWEGGFTTVLATIFAAEIVLTMTDFVTEARVRKPLGDVYPGERVTHAVMAILYGAMLAAAMPTLTEWWVHPTALAPATVDAPLVLRWVLTLMAAGVLISGIRDFYAAAGLPHGAWPWPETHTERAS